MELGKKIGHGNTANVYEWQKGKVLKLFHQDYPREAVEREFQNAMAIKNMDFAKAKAYEIILYEERRAIIYEKLEGESLLDWLMKTGDIQGCAAYMAKLHKQILKNKIINVVDYKEFLKSNIENQSLKMLDKLPNGNTLCHGDFHPGNIFISEGQVAVIDFMNVCKGNALYDIARTAFLMEYTPVPAETKDKENLLSLRKTLTDLYIKEMDVTREVLEEYLLVIAKARKGECPYKKI